MSEMSDLCYLRKPRLKLTRLLDQAADKTPEHRLHPNRVLRFCPIHHGGRPPPYP